MIYLSKQSAIDPFCLRWLKVKPWHIYEFALFLSPLMYPCPCAVRARYCNERVFHGAVEISFAQNVTWICILSVALYSAGVGGLAGPGSLGLAQAPFQPNFGWAGELLSCSVSVLIR